MRKHRSLVLLFSAALAAAQLQAQDTTVSDVSVYRGRVKRVTPATGLQQALDAAEPGDVITIAPGVYYESVSVTASGKPGAPIVICAEEGGTATISGGTSPDFKLEFAHVEGDLYKAPVPWTVRWVMADRRNLNAYEDLAGLKAFRTTGHDSKRPEDGPPEGFAWEDGVLYVRLLGGNEPNEAKVEIHRQYAGLDDPLPVSQFWHPRTARQRDTGANVYIKGSHVILAGLRLHLAPEAGVRVSGDHVTIRDCYIDGAHRGIVAGESAHLTVEHCEFSGYPTYQWVRWGQYAEPRKKTWEVVYNSNLCNTFIHHKGRAVKVRHNLIYECFDGMWPRDMGTLDPEQASEYAYNVIMSCGDDAIEFDTKTPINLRVHHNFIMDALVLLALSPVQGGGLTIDHNIVYVSPEYGLRTCTLFKFSCPGGFRRPHKPTQGCVIAHNTLVNSKTYLYWTGEDHLFENNVVENNIIRVRLSRDWKLPGFTVSRFNLHASPDSRSPANLTHLIRTEHVGFERAPPYAADALPVAPLQERGKAPRTATYGAPLVDFGLRPGSPAVDAGAGGKDDAYHHSSRGEAPDLGAIELGEEWQFPRPGPRWVVGEKTPWRPPLPPSLDPRWVGLQTSQ